MPNLPARSSLSTRALASRRALRAAIAAMLAASFVAGCTARDLTAPDALLSPSGAPGGDPMLPAPPSQASLVTCSIDGATHQMRCGDAGELTSRATRDLVVGKQDTSVHLEGHGIDYRPNETCAGVNDGLHNCFKVPVSVMNLLNQPLGTTDGYTADPTGVRVFFFAEPTSAQGQIVLANPSGTKTFVASNTKYMEYSGAALGADGILSTNETSSNVVWQFESSAAVQTFTFQVYVSAPVALPYGYVLFHVGISGFTAYEARPVGGSLTLTADPRNGAGEPITSGLGPVRFSSDHPEIASVDSITGAVSAVSFGGANITASARRAGNHVITGTCFINVTAGPPAIMTKVDGDGQTVGLFGTVAIPPSVLVTDAAGHPVFDIPVVFAMSVGPSSFTGDHTITNPSGIATVGSWSASSVAGGIQMQAHAGSLTQTFSMTVLPGGASNLFPVGSLSQYALAGTRVAHPPTVVLLDSYYNVVPGVAVTFTVTGGGGTITGGTGVTDSNGTFGVTSWTVGDGTTGCDPDLHPEKCGDNTLHASAAGQSLDFTVTLGDPSGNRIPVATPKLRPR